MRGMFCICITVPRPARARARGLRACKAPRRPLPPPPLPGDARMIFRELYYPRPERARVICSASELCETVDSPPPPLPPTKSNCNRSHSFGGRFVAFSSSFPTFGSSKLRLVERKNRVELRRLNVFLLEKSARYGYERARERDESRCIKTANHGPI